MRTITLFNFVMAVDFLSVFGSENPSNLSAPVVELTEHNFEEELSKSPLFVMFHVPECPNCDGPKKLLERLAHKMEDSNVTIAKADCSSENGLCQDSVCRTISKSSDENPDPHQKCIFPIIHEDKWIEQCVQKDDGDVNFSCPTCRVYEGKWINKEKQKWGICNQSCKKNTNIYFKPDNKVCEDSYKTMNVLYDALNTCADDEKCKMVKQTSDNYKGPFTICRNAPDIDDTSFQNYSSFEKKRIGRDCDSNCGCGFTVKYTTLDGKEKKCQSTEKGVENCVKLCKEREGCNGFEYNQEEDDYGNNDCCTYIEVFRHQNQPQQKESWTSCVKNCRPGENCLTTPRADGHGNCHAPITLSGTGNLCTTYEKGIRNSTIDVEECKDAAKKLGYEFKDSRKRIRFPRGCYLLIDNNRTYFNTHLTGQPHTKAEQVCKEEVIYVPSGYNQLCSDIDEFKVSDVNECKLAAEDLKFPYYGTIRTNSILRGCSYNRVQKKAYFNTISPLTITGTYEDAQQICKKPVDWNKECGLAACTLNPCLNEGFCIEISVSNYSCTCRNNCYGKNCENCSSGTRFQFDLGDPVLKFFKSSTASVAYRGPKTYLGLMAFISEQMGRGPKPTKNESELVLEAGCKKQEWSYNKNGYADSYRWIPDGSLLERGVCKDSSYRKHLAPETEQETTIVHSTIEYQTVRNVDAKEQTMSIDLVLTLAWFDPGIRTNFTTKDTNKGGVILSPDATKLIWTPDLSIWNRTAYLGQMPQHWVSLIRCKILSLNAIKEKLNDGGNEEYQLATMVEMKYSIKTTIYCTFEYSKYPMDSQYCDVKMGSSSSDATFTLLDKNRKYHTTKQYRSVGLNIEVNFFEEGTDNKTVNVVGFKVKMTRLIQPFLMMYYVPCIAIVLVSELGFIVPLTADGSSSLLVTNLLTLVSLFIYLMSESPSASDMNILGLYVLASLGFVLGAMIEFAFVDHIHRMTALKERYRNDESLPEDKTAKLSSKINPLQKENAKAISLIKLFLSNLNGIDLMAFFLHFFSFLLFNAVYWIQNSN